LLLLSIYEEEEEEEKEAEDSEAPRRGPSLPTTSFCRCRSVIGIRCVAFAACCKVDFPVVMVRFKLRLASFSGRGGGGGELSAIVVVVGGKGWLVLRRRHWAGTWVPGRGHIPMGSFRVLPGACLCWEGDRSLRGVVEVDLFC
jgi:hypothetical protein